jgi:DNA transformation protein
MAGGFQDLLEELFAPLGGVTIKRMFGGQGVFRSGMMFALVADDILYFKADEQTEPAFRKEGCGPWSYRSHKGEDRVMPYWRAPERLLDEPEEFAEWARAAFSVAERRKAIARPKTKPAPRQKPGPKAAAKPAAPKRAPARKAAAKTGRKTAKRR